MTQINLLPWREEARKARKLRYGLAAGATAVVALFFVLLMHLYYIHLINHQNYRVSYLTKALDDENTNLMDLKNKQKIEVSIDTSIRFLYGLRTQSYQMVRFLDELTRVVPEGIFLTRISHQKNFITLAGKASANLQITQLMESLSKSPVFKQAVLTQITGKESKEGQERTFELRVEQERE